MSFFKNTTFKTTHLVTVHKLRTGNNTMSNGGWFDQWPSNDACGSWSGYASSCKPFICPENLYIKKVNLVFRKANFDWRSSAGSIFIELGVYTMLYNGASDVARLVMEMGDFSGSTTPHGTYKYEIENFTERVGSNSFNKFDIIGFQLRKDVSFPGAVNSIINPLFQIHLEEF